MQLDHVSAVNDLSDTEHSSIINFLVPLDGIKVPLSLRLLASYMSASVLRNVTFNALRHDAMCQKFVGGLKALG